MVAEHEIPQLLMIGRREIRLFRYLGIFPNINNANTFNVDYKEQETVGQVFKSSKRTLYGIPKDRIVDIPIMLKGKLTKVILMTPNDRESFVDNITDDLRKKLSNEQTEKQAYKDLFLDVQAFLSQRKLFHVWREQYIDQLELNRLTAEKMRPPVKPEEKTGEELKKTIG